MQQVTEAVVRPRRVEDSRSRVVADSASVVFHPDRLDVLVHLRALEQLRGAPASFDDGVDWVATSNTLASEDVEPTVAELAAEMATAPGLVQEVVFGNGGRLVAGATGAAVSAFTDRPIRRRDVEIRGLDRSQTALVSAGVTPTELRGAVETWLLRDPRAAFIIVDHEARCADAALAEIERRYEVFHSDFEHLGDHDAAKIGLPTGGSMHLLAVRVSSSTIGAVVDRHGEAIVGSFRGGAAAEVARAVHSPDRDESSSPRHARALRARRRRARQAQAIAALRALPS